MKKIKNTPIIFPILYGVGFLGAAVIGFFGNSYFAYDIFNSLWADILYIVFLSSLWITAFVQEVCTRRNIKSVAYNFVIFIGGLTFFLFVFLGDVFTLLALIFSAVMLTVIGCRYALSLKKDHTLKPDIKQPICVGILLLFAMIRQMKISYISDIYLAWALIPAAVLFCVCAIVAFILLKNVFAKMYPTEGKRIFNVFCLGFILLFLVYAYSYTAIGVINSAFDGEPTKIECTIIEKDVRTGYRTVTQFKVKVLLDDKERWIDVPVTDYHELEEGDLIIIDYYNGALNFAYYAYSNKG